MAQLSTTMIPLEAEPDDEPLALPAPASETVPVPASQRRMSTMERLQVAIWIVDGHAQSRIQNLCKERGMPVPSSARISQMRHDEVLIEEAKLYLRRELVNSGLAEKAVRVRALQRHANRLEDIMDETGLFHEIERVSGFRDSKTVATERSFEGSLSKEYRETLEQIRKEVEPLERAIIGQQNNITINISEEDRAQLLDAAKWRPKSLPQLLVEVAPSDDVIDGEVVAETTVE